MTELNRSRQVLPRLLNQVNKLTKENEDLKVALGLPPEADYKVTQSQK